MESFLNYLFGSEKKNDKNTDRDNKTPATEATGTYFVVVISSPDGRVERYGLHTKEKVSCFAEFRKQMNKSLRNKFVGADGEGGLVIKKLLKGDVEIFDTSSRLNKVSGLSLPGSWVLQGGESDYGVGWSLSSPILKSGDEKCAKGVNLEFYCTEKSCSRYDETTIVPIGHVFGFRLGKSVIPKCEKCFKKMKFDELAFYRCDFKFTGFTKPKRATPRYLDEKQKPTPKSRSTSMTKWITSQGRYFRFDPVTSVVGNWEQWWLHTRAAESGRGDFCPLCDRDLDACSERLRKTFVRCGCFYCCECSLWIRGLRKKGKKKKSKTIDKGVDEKGGGRCVVCEANLSLFEVYFSKERMERARMDVEDRVEYLGGEKMMMGEMKICKMRCGGAEINVFRSILELGRDFQF